MLFVWFGAIWPMCCGPNHAAVEPRLYEVARSLHMSRLAIISRDRVAVGKS
jgi:hypothetical protein